MLGSVGAETRYGWILCGQLWEERENIMGGRKYGLGAWNLSRAKRETKTQLEVEEGHEKLSKTTKKDLRSKLHLWRNGYWNNTWPCLSRLVDPT